MMMMMMMMITAVIDFANADDNPDSDDFELAYLCNKY